LGEENNLSIKALGLWGSYKYLVNAVSGIWLTHADIKGNSGVQVDSNFLNKINADGNAFDLRFITDTWALYQK
jgi:hypothetical protein